MSELLQTYITLVQVLLLDFNMLSCREPALLDMFDVSPPVYEPLGTQAALVSSLR